MSFNSFGKMFRITTWGESHGPAIGCTIDSPVIGLKATASHVTIVHMTVLLVALTAAKSGLNDKVRFIKSFLPNFEP